MLILLLFFTLYVSSESLFAGNGIVIYVTPNNTNTNNNIQKNQTNQTNQINQVNQINQIIKQNCNTYNECLNLLLQYNNSYTIIVKPNYWDGDCDKLNAKDYRKLLAEIQTYHNEKDLFDYTVLNVSGASYVLCNINKNTTITEIKYINLF